MRLINRNPSEAEKKLFANYGMYLIKREDDEDDSAFRKYAPINDITYARNRFIETNEWPEYLMPHNVDIEYGDSICFNMHTHEVHIKCRVTVSLLTVILELMNEWGWK